MSKSLFLSLPRRRRMAPFCCRLLSVALVAAVSSPVLWGFHGHLRRTAQHQTQILTGPIQTLPGETTLSNPQGPLTVKRILKDRVPMTLIEGGVVGTRRAAQRCDVRTFVTQSGAKAGLNGTFFADASLQGRDSNLIGPTLCGGETNLTQGACDQSPMLIGRPLVLMSPTQTCVVAYQPAAMQTDASLHNLLPEMTDAFLGGVWLVHQGVAATPDQLAQAHIHDAEDYRRRAFFVLEPDGRPGLGATTDVTSSQKLAKALQEAGVQEAVLLDSGFSTSLVYGHKIMVTGHTSPGLPSRPVPHALVLYAAHSRYAAHPRANTLARTISRTTA